MEKLQIPAIRGTDESTDSYDQSTDEGTDASTEDTLNTDSLDDASKAQFDQAEQFCEENTMEISQFSIL